MPSQLLIDGDRIITADSDLVLCPPRRGCFSHAQNRCTVSTELDRPPDTLSNAGDVSEPQAA